MPKEYYDCVDALMAEGKDKAEAQKTCAIAYYKKHGKTPQEAEKMGDDKTITDLAELRNIEIVKTGDHVAQDGSKVTYLEADLDQMIANAATLKDTVKPPIVVSHADGDASAAINAATVGAQQVGWMAPDNLTKKKNADGSVSLFASFKDIAKGAIDKIGTDLKRVSAEIYKNYKAGEKEFGKVIRRVSFVPIPSIKDMADVTQAHLVFGEAPDQPTTWVTLSEAAPESGTDGDHPATAKREETNMDIDITELSEKVIELSEQVSKMQEADKKKDEEITKLKASNEANATKLSEVEQQKKADDIDRFCADLLRTGRTSPALLKLGLKRFMAGLDDNEVVKFGEGTKTYDLTPLQFMKKFFMSFPKNSIVRFGEVAFGKDSTADLENEGKTAADRLSEATKKIMAEAVAAGAPKTYTIAFGEAQKANPDLAREYLADIGQTGQ
jgi:hypothetical protein